MNPAEWIKNILIGIFVIAAYLGGMVIYVAVFWVLPLVVALVAAGWIFRHLF